jgi:lysophospholipase L1-like esterase
MRAVSEKEEREGQKMTVLTVGDSVCWGQGLLEQHKFDSIFTATRGLQLARVAHSGAVIGTSTDSSTEVENGEVPVAWPSDWQQVLAPADWSQVELVLLNGGINDVSLTRILNPLTSTAQLTGLVNQFCNTSMEELLVATAQKLVLPNARIAVLGYFPILSSQSGATETQFRSLLELHGVSTSSVIAGDQFSLSATIPQVVANCLTFWNSSDAALQAAVTGANETLGKNVCVFVKTPFSEANAMWAPQPHLWELTPLLMPEDEVAAGRGIACKALYGNVVHIPQWVECDRASAGHPNVNGAADIAAALLAAL